MSRNIPALCLLATVSFFPLSGHRLFAQDQADHRKVVSRVNPEYPPLARTMSIAGTVRIEAVVEGNGVVKTAEVKGGHPMLAEAALRAVKRWKWESANRETHEIVELKFQPAAYH